MAALHLLDASSHAAEVISIFRQPPAAPRRRPLPTWMRSVIGDRHRLEAVLQRARDSADVYAHFQAYRETKAFQRAQLHELVLSADQLRAAFGQLDAAATASKASHYAATHAREEAVQVHMHMHMHIHIHIHIHMRSDPREGGGCAGAGGV